MKFFAANWKLFKAPNEARAFFEAFHKRNTNKKDEIIFFPSAFAMEASQQMLRGSRVRFGAQNVYAKGSGAFTGENSAEALKTMGARYALVGHSERRQLFGEVDDLLAQKVSYIHSLGLSPMLCIGESLEQRKSGQTVEVCRKQLEAGLKLLQPTQITKAEDLVIAYEPVWAIGTGVVATPEQVRETHAEISKILTGMGFQFAPVLYGGSVKPDNAKELIQIDKVDGFLVGGASLEVESFAKICESF